MCRAARPTGGSPIARATARLVRTQSFSKSTSVMSLTVGSMYSANFFVASTVSPP